MKRYFARFFRDRLASRRHEGRRSWRALGLETTNQRNRRRRLGSPSTRWGRLSGEERDRLVLEKLRALGAKSSNVVFAWDVARVCGAKLSAVAPRLVHLEASGKAERSLFVTRNHKGEQAIVRGWRPK